MHIEKRQDLLLNSVKKYYKEHPNQWAMFVKIINKESDISLRSIDYLCTNYAKRNDIDARKKKGEPIYIHEDYKSQLKAYSKLQFDMFRRHERITIPCNLVPNKKLETTCGQMNFFRWFFMRKIHDWMLDPINLKKIENDMTSNAKSKSVSKKSSEKQKIAKAITKCARRHNVDVKVTFK